MADSLLCTGTGCYADSGTMDPSLGAGVSDSGKSFKVRERLRMTY